ncbi:MAG: NAD(P)-dependent alcohol dehydrogenase [Actinomycetota bacterium]
MKAVVQQRYWGADALAVADLPMPDAGPDQVVVRVAAASVNADVWHMVHGRPRVLRLMGGGIRRPTHPTPGIDFAGTIHEVGAEVDGWAIGDEVYAETVTLQWKNGGTYAEYAVVDAHRLEAKPAAIGFAEAATVPSTGGIAVNVTYDEGQVAEGHEVLVNGAAGGVGAFAVQLAAARGAVVTAVDRAETFDRLRSLGATHTIDHTEHDFTTLGQTWDRIIDVATMRPIKAYRGALNDDGRYVVVGHYGYDPTWRPWLGNLPGFFGQILAGLFVGESVPMSTKRTKRPLQVLSGLIETGQLTPSVAHRFGLDEVGAAIDLLASGQATGRIVIEP